MVSSEMDSCVEQKRDRKLDLKCNKLKCHNIPHQLLSCILFKQLYNLSVD